jgi:chaperone modulatory protein CbpM
MSRDSAVRIDAVEGDIQLELEAFARACGVETAFVSLLVDEELVRPASAQGCFGGAELARVRRIRRLQRAFDANLQSVAVMVDLLDEIERLRSRLRREGLEP